MEATKTVQTESPVEEKSTSGIDVQEALKKLRDEVDNLNLDLAVERAQSWVKEHPVLATGAALGVGLIAASLIVSLLDDDEDVAPTISDRVRQQVATASDSIQHHASTLHANLSERADEVGEQLMDTVEPILRSEHVASAKSSASKMSTSVVETVKAAAAAAVVQKFSDWLKRFAK